MTHAISPLGSCTGYIPRGVVGRFICLIIPPKKQHEGDQLVFPFTNQTDIHVLHSLSNILGGAHTANPKPGIYSLACLCLSAPNSY